MSTLLEIAAVSIGRLAFSVSQSAEVVRVIGVSARGLFLLAPPQRIVFVSFEHYRSPLTINLARSVDRLHAIQIGATATFSDRRLIFSPIEFSVLLSADAVWQCPPPAAPLRPLAEQRQTLCAIAAGVLTRRDRTSLAALLPRLLDLPDVSPLSAALTTQLDQLRAIQCAMRTGDSRSTVDGLLGLLGQGRGLTPSGDDVVIGLLLMLARFRRFQSSADSVAAPLMTEAYQRTTAISANLIECAAIGQGDERLITVVDGIASVMASVDTCVECILDWGSSSGIDALVGMAMAVCGASC